MTLKSLIDLAKKNHLPFGGTTIFFEGDEIVQRAEILIEDLDGENGLVLSVDDE
ncbi:hypothetical protein LCGC14_2914030 [marine sediment metagenome]|uniref:Uncharacterized protein n=1 Tax=marine sediment metagenome TaxID=412755 RepID=A0A0F8XQV3_9ZZZZ